MTSVRRIGLAILVVLLFLSLPTTVRGLREQFDHALALRGESAEAKRRITSGSWYVTIAEVRRRVPASGSVDFVMLTPEGRDVAVFAGAALAPRDCRFFSGWDDWRARRRATFFQDERAANAPPGPPPGAASCVVLVDGRLDPPLRIGP
jgi:hypothetical protein